MVTFCNPGADTVCPRGLNPVYIVTTHIKWVKTFWKVHFGPIRDTIETIKVNRIPELKTVPWAQRVKNR